MKTTTLKLFNTSDHLSNSKEHKITVAALQTLATIISNYFVSKI